MQGGSFPRLSSSVKLDCNFPPRDFHINTSREHSSPAAPQPVNFVAGFGNDHFLFIFTKFNNQVVVTVLSSGYEEQ